MDRPYDGQVEQKQIRDTTADKAAGQNLSSEATNLSMNSLANRVANCEAAGLSFSNVTSHIESQTQRSAMDLAVLSGMLDAGQYKGNFGSAFLNSMLDTGGSKVSMDASTGKLVTTDSGGRTIDYDSKLSGEQSAQRNAAIIPALFIGSPLALFGMGATLTMSDQVQNDQHKQESNRIKTQLSSEMVEPKAAQPQQNFNSARGYLSDLTMMSALLSQEKKMSSSTQDIYSLSGLAPELFPNQRAIERNGRARENDKKAKKRVEMDKMAGIERKRQQMRVKLSVDRSSLTTKNLTKRKEQLENAIEAAQGGKASLAEVSRMHSELEVLERALTRLSGLGL